MPTVTKLRYSGNLTLSVAEHANSALWVRQSCTWEDLVNRLAEPYVSHETLAEYQALDIKQKNKLKDVGGYVGGTLQGSRRRKEDVIGRQLITLDVDTPDHVGLFWEMFCFTFQCAGVMHSTRSYTEKYPRVRLIVPAQQELTPANYSIVAKNIMEVLGPLQFDKTTHEPNRLMFWPSRCSDGPFIFEYNDAPWLNCLPILDQAKGIELMSIVPDGNPRELVGVVGDFCKKFTVPMVIESYLSHVYEPMGNCRYKLAGTVSTAGFIVYDNGAYGYSHHSTDPAYGAPRNAFDLLRIHMFGELDKGLPDKTPHDELPSTKAVIQWIADNNIIPINKWYQGLTVNAKGLPASTIDNMCKVLQNDTTVSGNFYYDEFADKLMVAGDFPWIGFIDRASFVWNDVDDAGIRSFLEHKYGMADMSKVNDAISLTALQNKVHPVRDYINKLEWDGIPRMESLLIDFLSAEDSVYVRSVTRKALIGAVARVMRPGVKHDHVLVLVGPQGCRKSTTILKLGGKWYSDSLFTMTGKEAYEALQGFWIIEISEMAAARKADIEQMKQFISKRSDNFRSAYARRTLDHPRQCVFIGSTNDEEFIKDQTGGRRFWPVSVNKIAEADYNALNQEYIDQIWAEAYVYYKAGEPWHLSEEQETTASEVQEKYTSKDERVGMVKVFLDRPVPSNWYEMEIPVKVSYIESGMVPDTDRSISRNRICGLELWVECFGGDPKDYSRMKGREMSELLAKAGLSWKPTKIDFGKGYGQQRGYKKEQG